MQVAVRKDGSEQVVYNHAEIPFYVESLRLSRYDGFSGLSHWHEDVELICICRGHMWYQINAESVLLKTGQGIFVNSRQLHCAYTKDYTDCDFICVRFPVDLLTGNRFIKERCILPLTEDSAYPYVELSDKIAWQNQILENMKDARRFETEKEEVLSMQLSALTIFSNLQKNLPITGKTHTIQEQSRLQVKHMIGYIQEHYSEKITLKQLADAASISKSQCGILFQKHTNKSPMEYLTEYRLTQAISLLKHTDKTMIEIALETGFNGSSYFCEVFKRSYKISPSKFRMNGMGNYTIQK